MRIRPRDLVPALLMIGVLVAAATPALTTAAHDGKALAAEQGLLDLDAIQPDPAPAVPSSDAAAAPSLPTPGAECTKGVAGPYPCRNVDLLGIVPMAQIGGPLGADVWGWTDDETGREIAIPTTTYGAAFVDVTDPSAPVVLGRAFIGGEDTRVLWRDVKVYDDHAYVVSEHADTHLQIFDMHRFDDVTSDQGTIEPDAVFEGFGSAHNFVINTDTGFGYAVAGDTCQGGMDILDLRGDPKAPEHVGCVTDQTLDDLDPRQPFGAVHDAQCVLYHGPDPDYNGETHPDGTPSEICFTANEGRGVFIVDVTDKANPRVVAHRTYDRINYAHQGWLTADHRHFVFGDELDELLNGEITTATFTIEADDLDDPSEVMTWEHETQAIDHNIYIEDGYVWQANYTAGLRILDYTPQSIAAGEFLEVGFFDVDPGEDAPVFAGAWTAYPFFDSGTIAVNSFDSGLFLLRADLPEKAAGTAAG